MLIQAIYDITSLINFILHFLLDWMLNIPVLKYPIAGILFFRDGYKEIQYRLFFEDFINLQTNPHVYSPVHYHLNLFLHKFFALLYIIAFIVLVAWISKKTKVRRMTRGIMLLENKLNDKLEAMGSPMRYECLYENWKGVIKYDEDPYDEARRYMRECIEKLDSGEMPYMGIGWYEKGKTREENSDLEMGETIGEI